MGFAGSAPRVQFCKGVFTGTRQDRGCWRDKSLYCKLKRQLLGQALNTAKASFYPSLIQHPKLLVTSANDAFFVLV